MSSDDERKLCLQLAMLAITSDLLETKILVTVFTDLSTVLTDPSKEKCKKWSKLRTCFEVFVQAL